MFIFLLFFNFPLQLHFLKFKLLLFSHYFFFFFWGYFRSQLFFEKIDKSTDLQYLNYSSSWIFFEHETELAQLILFQPFFALITISFHIFKGLSRNAYANSVSIFRFDIFSLSEQETSFFYEINLLSSPQTCHLYSQISKFFPDKSLINNEIVNIFQNTHNESWFIEWLLYSLMGNEIP